MSYTQSWAPPASAVQAPSTSTFYPTTQPAPFYPAQIPTTPAPPPPPSFVTTQAPQFKPQPWTPPQAPARVPVPQVPMQAVPQIPAQQQWAPMPGMPTHFQVPQGLAPSSFGYYGYAPDQMWNALAAVPPMWRPQQPGESFTRRWAVNTGLNAVETILSQLLLGVRQMFLPSMPMPPKSAVVDVTPPPSG